MDTEDDQLISDDKACNHEQIKGTVHDLDYLENEINIVNIDKYSFHTLTIIEILNIGVV